MLFSRYGQSLIVQAPAKLNLFLEILAKRSDGYHELESLLVSVGLYDTISFTDEETGRVCLSCFQTGSPVRSDGDSFVSIPGGHQNLVVRAANLLKDYAGIGRGVRIKLQKRIPAAAGLAGGSSDAAATLMALNRFWNLSLTGGELHELGSQLGSDVPFFLGRSAAAICRGRGERVEPVSLTLGLHFVIVCPSVGLSTAAVYRRCRVNEQPCSAVPLVDALRTSRLGQAARLLHNSLQSAAEDLKSEVRRMSLRLSKQPVLGHLMSGSGTACFGLCANQRQALLVAARLRAARIGCVFAVRCQP